MDTVASVYNAVSEIRLAKRCVVKHIRRNRWFHHQGQAAHGHECAGLHGACSRRSRCGRAGRGQRTTSTSQVWRPSSTTDHFHAADNCTVHGFHFHYHLYFHCHLCSDLHLHFHTNHSYSHDHCINDSHRPQPSRHRPSRQQQPPQTHSHINHSMLHYHYRRCSNVPLNCVFEVWSKVCCHNMFLTLRAFATRFTGASGIHVGTMCFSKMEGKVSHNSKNTRMDHVSFIEWEGVVPNHSHCLWRDERRSAEA